MAIQYNHEDYDKLNNAFQDILDYGEVNAADLVYHNLDLLLIKEKKQPTNIDLFKKFIKLKTKYGFACLSTLTEKEILDLLKSHLAVAFEISGYELWEQIKSYLTSLVVYDDRDRFKDEVKSILIGNQAKLTISNIIIYNKEVLGTVENWIRDYHGYLGTGIIDQVLFEQYFINSANIKKLSPPEKNKVRTLLKLFEKLKLSSKTPLGYEEKVPMKIDGQFKIWNEGRLEDIDLDVEKVVKDLQALGFFKENNKVEAVAVNEAKAIVAGNAISDLAELKQLAASYPPGSFERKVVEEEIGKVRSKK